MASTSTTFSTKSRLDHKISTTVTPTLPAITYTRTISAGQPTTGSFRVETYRTQLDKNYVLPVQKVNTYQEYIAGCTQHERCLGHFCITPRGTVLLPQRLASTLGVMSNDYAKMAESIFIRDSPSQELIYRERLKSLMLGKSGKMRGEMPSGPVDGSAREVVSLCWEMPPNHIAIPRRVADNMRILRVQKDKETQLPLGQYVEDKLREEDWVIAVRPPSLWAGNVQPMRVILWDHECFGLSPSNADEFHADHDGDEMQIYFIGKETSIKQCEMWHQLNTCKFQEAVNKGPLPRSIHKGPAQLRENFMVHSTLSVKELLDGEKLPGVAKAARVKEPMANMFVERLKDPSKVFRDFTSESIRGIKDVMAQQLNQGLLGDMSRQARIAASCIQYKGNGVFHIKSSTETIRVTDISLQGIISDTKYPLMGNPCMRAVSALCGVAQQAALDSHRVSQAVSSKLDLVDNLIKGGNQSLVAFLPGSDPPCSWKYSAPEATYCIVNNESVKSWAVKVVAAYNPVVLRSVKLVSADVKNICRKGIAMVCNYYEVKLSTLELYSFAELLCYRCDAYHKPITTKDGLLERDMRWMAVIFANHYGKLRTLQYKGKTRREVHPEIIIDAAAYCNFDFMQ